MNKKKGSGKCWERGIKISILQTCLHTKFYVKTQSQHRNILLYQLAEAQAITVAELQSISSSQLTKTRPKKEKTDQ